MVWLVVLVNPYCNQFFNQLNIKKMKTIEDKAKMISEQCKPCSEDFYNGMYQGVVIALTVEPNIKISDFIKKRIKDLKKRRRKESDDIVDLIDVIIIELQTNLIFIEKIEINP